jgi:hypothetical protein
MAAAPGLCRSTTALAPVEAHGARTRPTATKTTGSTSIRRLTRSPRRPTICEPAADWRHAIFAYNHAGWYVDQVVSQAASYRDAATAAVTAPTSVVRGDGAWLADVPGMPGERCDQRIVSDVVMLIRVYGVSVTDCYGGAPHDTDGEHPLGLATDLAPANGDWTRTMRLARAYGWAPDCATTGCGGRGPFKVVLYNGYPGHGDPAHSSQPHLHLSWVHAPAAPFTRASWVHVLSPSTSSDDRRAP